MGQIIGVVVLFAALVALGLWNRSRSRVLVRSPRVLVLNLGPDAAVAAADAQEFRTHFDAVVEATDLASLDGQQFDVIHVLASLTPDGRIGDQPAHAVQLSIVSAQPKLVILGSDNAGELYASHWPAPYPYNCVMTLSRDGATFWSFFHKLFDLMFRGCPMPIAWVRLAPQNPHGQHLDVPSTICQLGAGQLVFAK